MDLQTRIAEIEQLGAEPPFDQWHPPFCGDIDMRIKSDGSWWYMGSPINRERMIKLFATVLIKVGDEYFLKTPAELVRIQVDDAPFVITQWHKHDSEQGEIIEVRTNTDLAFVLSKEHPVNVDITDPEHPRPYVTVHRGLKALVHRNVYYQWVEMATLTTCNGMTHLTLHSGCYEFSLGQIPAD